MESQTHGCKTQAGEPSQVAGEAKSSTHVVQDVKGSLPNAQKEKMDNSEAARQRRNSSGEPEVRGPPCAPFLWGRFAPVTISSAGTVSSEQRIRRTQDR